MTALNRSGRRYPATMKGERGGRACIRGAENPIFHIKGREVEFEPPRKVSTLFIARLRPCSCSSRRQARRVMNDTFTELAPRLHRPGAELPATKLRRKGHCEEKREGCVGWLIMFYARRLTRKKNALFGEAERGFDGTERTTRKGAAILHVIFVYFCLFLRGKGEGL